MPNVFLTHPSSQRRRLDEGIACQPGAGANRHADRRRGGTMKKSLMGRRHFMKSTLAGVGGFFFLASNDKKQEEKVTQAIEELVK